MPTVGKKSKKVAGKPNCQTNESISYLSGLYQAYEKEINNYLSLGAQLMALEARVELAEKTLILTRDHFALAIQRTEGAAPHNWTETLARARFVGSRLSEACIELLKEYKKLTLEQLLDGLNSGQYRFRTNTPLREIHAALLKQPGVERVGNALVWIGGEEEQLKMRLKNAAERITAPEEKAS